MIEPDPLEEMPMDQPPFHYQPKCSTLGCGKIGVYKIAVPWSYGNISELKNYGVCCEDHKGPLLIRAKGENASLVPTEGERIGEVGVFQVLPGVRDADLTRVE
jgi:hypothetical protein